MPTVSSSQRDAIAAVGKAAQPLTGAPHDYDALLEMIGDAHYVLLGEASHGTHEFYRARAEITKRLIQEKAFTAVAVEADWPDAYRVNCYVRGLDGDGGANDALSGFKRFPTWMWRNTDVLEFVGWLRGYNAEMPKDAVNAGFYGLDLYSLYTSLDEVLHYLDEVDAAAQRARERYSCFEMFAEDTQAYGYTVVSGKAESCENAVVNQLLELQRHAAEYSQRDGHVAADQYFYAEQNARLAKNAEEYYRSMFRGRPSSWNLRDSHMVQTLEELTAHLDRNLAGKERTRVVVWEHNSHLGDARATEMGERGEHNVGQLVRQKHGRDAVLVGFSTYDGTVTAAADWDKPAQRKRVRPALEGSSEALFHEASTRGGAKRETPDFFLNLRDDETVARALMEPRLERVIGVIYRPETERWSHYFHAILPQQFDAILHFDRTRAVEPLEPSNIWHRGEEAPETYPSGI